MFLKPEITLFNFSFPAIYLILLVALVTGLFVYWYEAVKDGFSEEKVLDLFFLTFFPSILMPFLVKFVRYRFLALDTQPNSLVLLSLGTAVCVLFLFCRKRKWSFFRVSDIFSLAGMSVFSVAFSGFFIMYKDLKYIYPVPLLIGTHYFLSLKRNVSLKSGYAFSIFLIVSVILGKIYAGTTSAKLLFYVILITISLINIAFRERKRFMENKVPLNLINLIKEKLQKREKSLKAEQKILYEEDPYLKEGRARDNADPVDEAILEDQQKEIIDHQKRFSANMLESVRKALARIKIGKYGVCEVCGKPIEQGRLKIYPEATTCVAHSSNKSEPNN